MRNCIRHEVQEVHYCHTISILPPPFKKKCFDVDVGEIMWALYVLVCEIMFVHVCMSLFAYVRMCILYLYTGILT